MGRLKEMLGGLAPPPAASAFDGTTYEPQKDFVRLNGQMLRVFDLMKDGVERSLAHIANQTAPGTEAAVSARLRDLRKPKYGGHTIERRRAANGLFYYRLTVKR